MTENVEWSGTRFSIPNRQNQRYAKFIRTSSQSRRSERIEKQYPITSIRARSEVKAGTSRMSVALQGVTEYVYLPGPTETLRYVVSDQGFQVDEAWAETYRTHGDGSTQGPAMSYMGGLDAVVFSSNDTIIYGVTEPLKIYSKSTTGSADPLKSRQAVSTSKPRGTFSEVSGDPFKSGIFIAQDAINGLVAGWQLGHDGILRRIWERDRYLMSAGPAVAVDREHVYMDHRQCDDDGKNCTFFLTILDLNTGAELARTEVAATLPTVGHIFVGRDDVFYMRPRRERKRGSSRGSACGEVATRRRFPTAERRADRRQHAWRGSPVSGVRGSAGPTGERGHRAPLSGAHLSAAPSLQFYGKPTSSSMKRE